MRRVPVSVWVSLFLLGLFPVGQGHVLLDDGQNGDAKARDGIYTATGIVHAVMTVRDPDTGPRTVRLAAEVEDAEGLRHATAVDIGILTVVRP